MLPPTVDGYRPYFLRDAVENVLLALCGSCHGPGAPPEGAAGISFIGDVNQLAAAGLIVPLSSAASPVIRSMVEGRMPPPESDFLQATEADIDTVVSFVDNPRYWPCVTRGSEGEAEALPDAD